MKHDTLYRLSAELGTLLKGRGFKLASAESCTGGGLGQAITAVPGSSNWYERGFITYSNESKRELLGVRATTLRRHGAVSEAVVRDMARGALTHSRAQIAVAVSGVAGPGGGSPEKPLGTVCLAWAGPHRIVSETRLFKGNRQAVRRAAVKAALQGVIKMLG
ncbi:MAG: CinA family protein [Burkholderiales bacterium]